MTRATLADLSALAEKSRERFEDLATRFRASARKAGPPALTEGYWQGLRDLFTRDVTPEGLRQLLQHEAHETFRFLRSWPLSDFANRPEAVDYRRIRRHPKRTYATPALQCLPQRRVLCRPPSWMSGQLIDA